MNRGARRNLWGWTLRGRVALALMALAFAVPLGVVARPRPFKPAIAADLVVDPNTAPPGVLLALPRLGPVLVGRIVAERERKPFQSLDDLDARVRGVGPATAAALRPYLSFGTERPLPP